MSRAPFLLLLASLAQPLLGAPPDADPKAAAAIQAPALPPGAAALPAAAAPVAPPLPGQLEAPPATPLPPVAPLPSLPDPALAAPTPPRPALAPPNPLPDLPRPAMTPAPSVPLNQAGKKQASSTSSSGQFIVHGDDLKLRSAFSGQCEETAAKLRQLLKDKDSWQLPIVILLKTGEAARAPGPAADTIISQISNGGFHLQVTVNVRADLRPADLRAELIRVLLAERILRHQKELATTRERLLPDWVFTGVLEALDYRQRARPSALFAAIFKSGKIYGIEEIIEASASAIEDGLSKTIYQTSCCALVLALLDQPEGGLRMGKFLNSLASDKRPERELLNQWYPGFAATPASLNKWWSLQMATLASPSVSEPLSAAETAKQLDQALTLQFKAKASDLPKPRPVVATVEPSPSQEKETPPVEETGTEEKKPSFFSRLNPFGKRAPSDDEIIKDAAAQAALAETASSPATADPAPEPAAPRKSRTLLGHYFDKESPAAEVAEAAATPEAPALPAAKSSDTQPKTASKEPAAQPAAPKPEAKTPETAATTASPDKEKEDDNDKGKGSVFNPLNWFRGDKKEKPQEPAAPADAPPESKADKAAPKKAAEDKQQAALPVAAGRLLWAWSPLAGDVYTIAAEAAEDTPPSRQVEGFFGLKFGKKKEKAKPEEPAPDAPAADPAAPKSTPAKTTEAPAAKPKPNKEESKTDKPKTDGAAEDAPPAEAEKSKPAPAAPIKIKPLFGSGKKDTPAPDVDAPPAPVGEKAPETPAPSKTAETKPKARAKTSAAEPSGSGSSVDASLPIEDYAVIMKRKDRAEILGRNVNALAALQTRAAVLFRPIVSEYAEVVAALMEGKTKGVDERLRSLRARSNAALAQSKAVRDFVDLYEANENVGFTGLFDDYLNLPETIEKELPPRVDPLSHYLDALDREFSKE